MINRGRIIRQVSMYLFIGLLAFACSFNAEAQKRSKKKKKSDDFMEHVWYGANIGLDMIGGSGYTQFNVILSPMAGYKFTERFSMGPRLIFDYAHYRFRYSTGVESFNLYSLGAGGLMRFKVINGIFAHGEFNVVNNQYLTISAIKKNKTLPHALLGIGFNGGGGEILLLYDFLHPTDDLSLPFEFRLGYTVNF